MGKVIIIASGKGGTGKTTLTANLAAALALQKKSVIAVDLDMGLRNLDVALGMESSIVFDIADVVEGYAELDDALIKDSRFESLFFIPAPQTRSSISLERDSEADIWRSLWERLAERFDYCLIDAPAGVDGGFIYGAYGADCAIIVTHAETAALRDADRVISLLEDKGIDDIRLVINRIRPELIERGIMPDIDRCLDMLRVPLLGIIPDDLELTLCSLKGELAVNAQNSAAAAAIESIARRITGEHVPVTDFERAQRTSIWKRLRGFLGFGKE